MKRISGWLLIIVLLFSISFRPVSACDEKQTNTYVTQILFGNKATARSSDINVKMLMDALYLCSEQADGIGKEKIDYLKSKKVSGVPSLSKINIDGDLLFECSHNSWEYELTSIKKEQSLRKKLLQNTVNKIFDFGTINNLFMSKNGKCNSFAALLYYSHILSDYLADDPAETEVFLQEKSVASYSGKAYKDINGGKPSFTSEQKKDLRTEIYPGELDELKRCGAVYAVISAESMNFVGPRPKNLPDPVAWNTNEYPGIVNNAYVFNRCHLIGRQFCGIDNVHNLITGTKYLNDTMSFFEQKVSSYIKQTGNHVSYRATPIYKGNNKLASGVQLEAYSIEDSGNGICFNVYCYNVQPGIDIDYSNGENTLADVLTGRDNILPFVVQNPSESNPDLIFEMNKHLKVLFDSPKNKNKYTAMKNEIATIANEARVVIRQSDKNQAQHYMALKQLQYRYLEVLKSYIPLLLSEEDFFKSAFN